MYLTRIPLLSCVLLNNLWEPASHRFRILLSAQKKRQLLLENEEQRLQSLLFEWVDLTVRASNFLPSFSSFPSSPCLNDGGLENIIVIKCCGLWNSEFRLFVFVIFVYPIVLCHVDLGRLVSHFRITHFQNLIFSMVSVCICIEEVRNILLFWELCVSMRIAMFNCMRLSWIVFEWI